MDEDLPLDVLGVLIGDVDEGFKEVNAGDSDQRGRELDLDRTGVDMCQPFRPVGVMLKIEFAHECGVAADDHHGQQIRHHRDVDLRDMGVD